MKTLTKLIAIFILTFLLTGCEKEEYCIQCFNVEYKRNLYSGDIMVSKSWVELKCNLTEDDIKAYEDAGTYAFNEDKGPLYCGTRECDIQ